MAKATGKQSGGPGAGRATGRTRAGGKGGKPSGLKEALLGLAKRAATDAASATQAVGGTAQEVTQG